VNIRMISLRAPDEGFDRRTTCAGLSRHPLATALLALVSMVIGSAALAGDLDKVILFNIEAETLNSALLQFAAQAHVRISFVGDSERDRERARTLKGAYAARDALAALLKGTQLAYLEEGNTVEIVQHPLKTSATAGPPSDSPDPPVTRGRPRGPAASKPQKSPAEPPAPSAAGNGSEDARSEEKGATPNKLDEVVVTGTHIRGAPPQATPLIVFTGQDIRNSGYPNIQEFMQSIPQNFGSVGSGAISLGDNIQAGNEGFGTAADLRGLGPDSTLVLVNGHRIAPAGYNGAFSDISVLPIAAIERVEILMAGASAIYGSDAVGGVVNFILRKNLQGAETSVDYGGVTSGGLRDYRVDQSQGVDWSSGSAFLSYEYHDETPLASSDRSFSENSSLKELLPESRQNALFADVNQTLSDALQLHADFLYAGRHNHVITGEFGPAGIQEAQTDQYQGTLGADWSLARTWVISSSVSVGRNSTLNEASTGSNRGIATELVGDIDANGVALTLRTGPVRVALGGQVRDDRFDQIPIEGLQPIDRGQRVGALFAETRLPLVGPNANGPISSVPILELDLAGRYEHYSDFGSSANPSVGLAFRPARAVRFRSTWASSFAAPQLWELYGGQDSELLNSPDPQNGFAKSAALVLVGANPSLQAERSTQWTAGVDLMPESLGGASIQLTYYEIHYKDRIASPNIPILFGALDSGAIYDSYIQRDPSPLELTEFTSAPFTYVNATLLPIPALGPPRALSDAVAVVDDRLRNIGVTDTNGLDVLVNDSLEFGEWRYSASLDSTYVFKFTDIPLPGSAPVEVLNSLDQPVNFRFRLTGGLGWGPLDGGVALNFVNRYTDATIPSDPVPVASWTTVDLHARYTVPDSVRSLGARGLQIALSCTNCFNRDPPYVSSASDIFSRGYDPTNANPLGRFVSVSLSKRW
jgi:iron complex outermembrane recepter protein